MIFVINARARLTKLILARFQLIEIRKIRKYHLLKKCKWSLSANNRKLENEFSFFFLLNFA